VEKAVKNLSFFGSCQKMPKVNNGPISENSPNLVTPSKTSEFTHHRLLGDCLLWVVFLKITQVAKFWVTFPKIKVVS
jgi:hypothetical protein